MNATPKNPGAAWVHTGGVLPIAPGGQVIRGNAQEQASRVLERMDEILLSAGTTLRQVAALTLYVSDAADLPGIDAAMARVWPTRGPARLTVVAESPLAGARLQLAALALPADAPRAVIQPAGWPAPPGPFSYGIRAGDTLFIAGLGPGDANQTGVDLDAQTESTLRRAGEVLHAAGLDYRHVATGRVFVRDPSFFHGMNRAYGRFFPEAAPARATVVAGGPDALALVQMAFVATEDPDRRAITSLPSLSGKHEAPSPPPPYSLAVQAGGHLHVSGHVGERGDIVAQTRQSIDAIARIIDCAGGKLADTREALIYLTQAADVPLFERTWREYFPSDAVPRTIVITGLVIPAPVVEIMLTLRAG